MAATAEFPGILAGEGSIRSIRQGFFSDGMNMAFLNPQSEAAPKRKSAGSFPSSRTICFRARRASLAPASDSARRTLATGSATTGLFHDRNSETFPRSSQSGQFTRGRGAGGKDGEVKDSQCNASPWQLRHSRRGTRDPAKPRAVTTRRATISPPADARFTGALPAGCPGRRRRPRSCRRRRGPCLPSPRSRA